MLFLSAPGIEKLYSGAAMTKASLASRRCRNASAPGGKPSATLASSSYEGASKSRIDARSTVPPGCSIERAASPTSRALSEPARSEAAKTRKRTGSRAASDATGLAQSDLLHEADQVVEEAL